MCLRTIRFGIVLLGLSLLALAAQPAAQSGNGSLKVTLFPSGAKVAIDGTDTGKTTPMSIQRRRGSSHRCRLDSEFGVARGRAGPAAATVREFVNS